MVAAFAFQMVYFAFFRPWFEIWNDTHRSLGLFPIQLVGQLVSFICYYIEMFQVVIVFYRCNSAGLILRRQWHVVTGKCALLLVLRLLIALVHVWTYTSEVLNSIFRPFENLLALILRCDSGPTTDIIGRVYGLINAVIWLLSCAMLFLGLTRDGETEYSGVSDRLWSHWNTSIVLSMLMISIYCVLFAGLLCTNLACH